jgi:hypothetical protein
VILPTPSVLAQNSAQTGVGAANCFALLSDRRSIDSAALGLSSARRGVCYHTYPSSIGRPGIPIPRPPAFSQFLSCRRIRGVSRRPVGASPFPRLSEPAHPREVRLAAQSPLGDFLPVTQSLCVKRMELSHAACVSLVSSDQQKGSMSCSARNGSLSASSVQHSQAAVSRWVSKPWLAARLASAAQRSLAAALAPALWSARQRTWHTARPTSALANNRLTRFRATGLFGRAIDHTTPRSGSPAAGVFLCLTPALRRPRAPVTSGKRGTNVQ